MIQNKKVKEIDIIYETCDYNDDDWYMILQ
jgi:hypothetical protein